MAARRPQGQQGPISKFIEFALDGGLDASGADQSAVPPRLLAARNALYARPGLPSRWPGHATISGTAPELVMAYRDIPHGIPATLGSQTLRKAFWDEVTYRAASALSTQDCGGRWTHRVRFPVVNPTAIVVSHAAAIVGQTVSTSAATLVLAWIEMRGATNTASTTDRSLYVATYNLRQAGWKLAAVEVAAGDLRCVKLAVGSGGVVGVYQTVSGGTHSLRSFVVTASTTSAPATSLLHGDLSTGGGEGIERWDVCDALTTGSANVSYAMNTSAAANEIRVGEIVSSTGAVSANSTSTSAFAIGANLSALRVCRDGTFNYFVAANDHNAGVFRIAKFNSSRVFQWVTSGGGAVGATAYDGSASIAADNAGGVEGLYVTSTAGVTRRLELNTSGAATYDAEETYWQFPLGGFRVGSQRYHLARVGHRRRAAGSPTPALEAGTVAVYSGNQRAIVGAVAPHQAAVTGIGSILAAPYQHTSARVNCVPNSNWIATSVLEVEGVQIREEATGTPIAYVGNLVATGNSSAPGYPIPWAEFRGCLVWRGLAPWVFDGSTYRPWGFLVACEIASATAGGGAGALTGAYTFRAYYERVLSTGERLLSPLVSEVAATAAGNASISVVIRVHPHDGTFSTATQDPIQIAVYAKTPSGSAFLRVATIPIPAPSATPTVTFTYNANVTTGEADPQQEGQVQDGVPPPPLDDLTATGDRAWGVPTGVPGTAIATIEGSLQWNESLTVSTDAEQLPLAGAIQQHGALYLLGRRAVYRVEGSGPSATDQGSAWTTPIVVGPVECVGPGAPTPIGIVAPTSRGPVLIPPEIAPGEKLLHIGARVRSRFEQSDSVAAADWLRPVPILDQRVVLFPRSGSSGSSLVWNWEQDAWTELEQRFYSAAVARPRHSLSTADAAESQVLVANIPTTGSVYYNFASGAAFGQSMVIQTPWIPVGGNLFQAGRLQTLQLLAHWYDELATVQIKVYSDWNDQDATHDTGTVAGDALSLGGGSSGWGILRTFPAVRRCFAFKVEITVTGASGPCVGLARLVADVSVEPALAPLAAANTR
jgi:hypothetical protein